MNSPVTPSYQSDSLRLPHQPALPPASPAPLLDKLKRQYAYSPLADLLDQLPASIKKASSRVVVRYQQLSTTQKVVGGVLLLLAVRQLTRGKRHHKGPQRF